MSSESVAIRADHVALKRLFVHVIELLTLGYLERLHRRVSVIKLEQVGWKALLTIETETAMSFYKLYLQTSTIPVYLLYSLCFIFVWQCPSLVVVKDEGSHDTAPKPELEDSNLPAWYFTPVLFQLS